MKRIIVYFLLACCPVLSAPAIVSALVISVESAGVDARLQNLVTIDISADNPAEIASAALTVTYDAGEIHLVAVESPFFADFAGQFAALPGAGTPFVRVEDGRTYIPITNAGGTINVPVEETINGEPYIQPLMLGAETATGTMISAARVLTGATGSPTLFTLTFDVSGASPGEYAININPSVIHNSDAGYDPAGESIPIFIGAAVPSPDQDLTNQSIFPEIPVDQIFQGNLLVTRSIANIPPTINGTPATSVAENAHYTFTPAASDSNADDTLTFSITNKPAWAAFNTTTGTLTGTPGNDDVGTTAGIVITVTDAAHATAALPAFSLTVVNVNNPPTIGGTPATSVNEGGSYNFTPIASDIDVGDTLTFSITNKPAWAAFNTTTGTLTGTPGNDDVGATAGIVITVTDAAHATAALPAFTLTVVNVNNPPTIGGTPATSVNEGGSYNFTPIASDIDVGDILTFSITNKPDWAAFNTNSGTLTGTPGNGNVGATTGIVIRVTDAAHATATLPAFTLTVVNANNPPTIGGTPSTSVEEGESYSFIPTANDIDVGDTLTFSITNKPTWTAFDTATGALTGMPGNDAVGTTTGIVITVSDTAKSSATLPAFNLTVSNTIISGDINDDGVVDLRDIYLLQSILTGTLPGETVFTEADVNGDGKLGGEESSYIMQVLTGVR
jgi:plastocyanin